MTLIILLLSCADNNKNLYIKKTTTVTYLGKGKYRVETELIIPKGLTYNARSDGVFINGKFFNIKAFRNGTKLLPKDYNIDSITTDTLVIPSVGSQRARYQFLSFDHSKKYNSSNDSIYFSYDVLIDNYEMINKTNYLRIWLGEIFTKTLPIVEIRSKLTINTNDNTFIPTRKGRWTSISDMVINRGERKYSWMYTWDNNSNDVTGEAIPYQRIVYKRNFASVLGDIHRTLDISKLDITKETFNIILRGLPGKEYLYFILPFSKKLTNPIFKLSVEIDGDSHPFFPDSNYFNKETTPKSYHYYFGSDIDSSFNERGGNNPYGKKSSSSNILALAFQIDSSSFADLIIECKYASSNYINKIDQFNYVAQFPLTITNVENSEDVFTIILPIDYYFSSFDLEDYIELENNNEITLIGIYSSKLTPSTLNFTFSAVQTRLLDYILWANRILLISAVILIILMVFNKSLSKKLNLSKYGVKILYVFATQFLISFFNSADFWDSFFYTESYLFIIASIIWLLRSNISNLIFNIFPTPNS